MNLLVQRLQKYGGLRTAGNLFIDGRYFCHTVEDVVRDIDVDQDGDIDVTDVVRFKVYGQTAIPAGRYRITLENSPKYGPDCLTVKDVPGFTGIRIHPGNTERDTEGCLVLGYAMAPDHTILYGTTRPAVDDLRAIIKRVIAQGESVWLTISNDAMKAEAA